MSLVIMDLIILSNNQWSYLDIIAVYGPEFSGCHEMPRREWRSGYRKGQQTSTAKESSWSCQVVPRVKIPGSVG